MTIKIRGGASKSSIERRLEILEDRARAGSLPYIILIAPNDAGRLQVREDYSRPDFHSKYYSIKELGRFAPPKGFNGTLIIDDLKE